MSIQSPDLPVTGRNPFYNKRRQEKKIYRNRRNRRGRNRKSCKMLLLRFFLFHAPLSFFRFNAERTKRSTPHNEKTIAPVALKKERNVPCSSDRVLSMRTLGATPLITANNVGQGNGSHPPLAVGKYRHVAAQRGILLLLPGDDLLRLRSISAPSPQLLKPGVQCGGRVAAGLIRAALFYTPASSSPGGSAAIDR